MNAAFKDELAKVPEKPGVYIMHDADDKVLYVGKAIILRNRLKSYFSDIPHSARITSMISRIARFEYIVCDTEMEALLLENNLIKKYKPKYNVLLKDDKGYPYIKVTLAERFPRVVLARKIEKDGSRYFGPYFSGYTVKQLLETLEGIVPLRTCRKKLDGEALNDRPCLNYHMGRCKGVCAGKVSRKEYSEMVGVALDFLGGNTAEAEARLRTEMAEAAKALEFERAAGIRDRIKALEALKERKKTSLLSDSDFDAVAVARDNVDGCAHIFFVRGGQVLGRDFFVFEGAADAEDGELMEAFLHQFYSDNQYVPPKIYIGTALADREETELLEAALEEKRGHRVHIIVPEKGEKRKLCDMVRENAEQTLRNRQLTAVSGKPGERELRTLSKLQELFKLPVLPSRIEAYDISNQGDSEINASMVVFAGGKPLKADYRLFKMKRVKERSDTDSMIETLERRMKRFGDGSRGFEKLPDLILADGGIGQVNAILSVLEHFDAPVPVLGMVKDDRHRSKALVGPADYDPSSPWQPLTREASLEFELKLDPDIWRFVTAVQDEAHRRAVTYNRKLTEKRYTGSVLDGIEGVGEKRKLILYKAFGSIKAMKAATQEEICAAEGIGPVFGKRIYEALHKE